MSKLIRASSLVLAGLLLCSSQSSRTTFAQESAKKPAADQQDEFQQVLSNAQALARQGRFDDAINEFSKAGKLHNDKCAECFQGVGQIHFKLGRLKEAAAAFRQAAELKPDNEAEVYNVLGVALYLQKEKASFEEAAAALQRAIDLSKGKLVKAYFNLGFALIKSGKDQEGIAALKKYVELDPGGSEVSHARAVIANTKMVDAKIAASFAVKSHIGAELSLEKLRGKVVLLDFWASWCLPCRFDMPEVRKIWKKFAGEQFTIIGINLDSNRSAFEAYMKEEGITWPQYYDGLGWGNKISQLYRVSTIPHTILVDQEGVIQATGLRGEELSEKIGDLLRKLNGSGSK